MNVPFKKDSSWAFVAISSLTLAALLFRIHSLGVPSLWYDEGATLWFATGGPERWISDTHPPFYYALVHLWLWFGHSEYWLRLLSVIPAVATIPVIFSLGKKLFGTNAGLLSAAFMVLLAFHIDHSQQARMYTFFVFFYACTLWSLVTVAREGRGVHWVSYVVAASLLSYTQGIGILYVGMIAVLFPLISPRPWRVSAWSLFFLANAIVLLVYFPWLRILREDHFRVGYLNWLSRPPWFSIPKTLFMFLCRYIPFTSIPHFRRGILLLRIAAVAIAVAPTLALMFFALRGTLSTRYRWAMATAVSALALPLLTVYLLSVFVTPMYIDRVLLPASVGFVLILGASVQEGKKRAPLLLVIAGLLISGLNMYYFFQFRNKEDFRSMSRDLQRFSTSEDLILFVADSSLPKVLIEYYDPHKTLTAARQLDLLSIFRSCHGTVDECFAPYSGEFRNSRKVWIVYAHDRGISEREMIQRWLGIHFTSVSNTPYEVLLNLSETRATGF